MIPFLFSPICASSFRFNHLQSYLINQLFHLFFHSLLFIFKLFQILESEMKWAISKSIRRFFVEETGTKLFSSLSSFSIQENNWNLYRERMAELSSKLSQIFPNCPYLHDLHVSFVIILDSFLFLNIFISKSVWEKKK